MLDTLIDARLLTSYEIREREGRRGHLQIEIVHESLLSAWPRLVRWQMQDAEGAKVRDELRQAALTWDEHDRSDDLLWTGTAFQEFELWRARYPGGLSHIEQAFGEAMIRHAARRLRRRRVAATVAFAVLLLVLGIFGLLWRQAVVEQQRTEAAQILAVGRLQLEDHPTAALAHALASLELADSSHARRFVMEALWRGPPATLLKPGSTNTLGFSSDGQWLATGGDEGVYLWSAAGGAGKPLVPGENFPPHILFDRHSNVLYVASRLTGNLGKSILFLSVPDGRELRRLDFDATTWFSVEPDHLITSTELDRTRFSVRAWPLPTGEPVDLGIYDATGETAYPNSDPTGSWQALGRGPEVVIVDSRELTSQKVIGRHDSAVTAVRFNPQGDELASGDENGTILFWPFPDRETGPNRQIRGRERVGRILFDATSSWMASGLRGPLQSSATAWVWDLHGPPGADPLPLRISSAPRQARSEFHPSQPWLAVANVRFVSLWPITGKSARVLSGHSKAATIAFSQDGRYLVSASRDGTVRLWPLSPDAGTAHRILFEETETDFNLDLKVSASGQALAGAKFNGEVWLIPLGVEPPQLLDRIDGFVTAVALSSDGRRAAAAFASLEAQKQYVVVWDLETGHEMRLEPAEGMAGAPLEEIFDLHFLTDGRLLSRGQRGLEVWNPATGSSVRLLEECCFASPSPTGRAVLLLGSSHWAEPGSAAIYDLDRGTLSQLPTHGNRIYRVGTFGPDGSIVVTGDADGVVRVGGIQGEEPHLLFGHSSEIRSVAVSPDERWVASASMDGEIRLWPMPDLDELPLHTLPREELLARLRTLTNLRAIQDPESSTGWSIEIGPFPGWEEVPEW